MDLKTLREKRAKLIADARAILDRADKETRDLTAEEVDSQRKMLDDARGLAATIRNTEELEAEERTMLPESQRTDDPPRSPAAQAAVTESREALRTFLIDGRVPASPERRTQSTLSGAAGGYAIAPDTSFYGRVIEALKFFGGVEAFGATILTTATGADLPIATDDDTANTGAIVAEEGSHTGATNVTMGQRTLKAFLYSSKIIKVSLQLLQDSSFDFEAYLTRKFGTRLGRIMNTHFTTGTGSFQPQGIVTGATVGRQGATGNSTTVSFDELKRAKHAVDIAYRAGARWMMNDTTALTISLVKDGNGRYLLTDSVREGDPPMLLGHPVVINNDMADLAASAKPIIFGQGSAYHIRRVSGLQIVRLNELYAENGQIGVLAFMRADGGLIDAGQGPVKVWQNSAA